MNGPHVVAIDTEAVSAALASVSAAEGDAAAVAIVTFAQPTFEASEYDGRGDGCYPITLYLALPTNVFARIYSVREEVEQRLLARMRILVRAYPLYWPQAVVVGASQTAPEQWRERALKWLSSAGVNNQGRVRSNNIAPYEHDGLLFRSQPEINLYRALKARGVSFAPLPVFIRGGESYRRIEPDFVLLVRGLVVVVEVDGDTVHQESPAEAHARTTMLQVEGAHVERVSSTECDSQARAEALADRLLAQMERVRQAR